MVPSTSTHLYEWIKPLESPNQIVLILTLHIDVIRAGVCPPLIGSIWDGWYRWYDNQACWLPVIVSMQRSIDIHNLNVDSRWYFCVLSVHIASTSSLCGNRITSIKCVNSGAHEIDTIWLAEGRFFGWWSQHNTIKSRQYEGNITSREVNTGRDPSKIDSLTVSCPSNGWRSVINS